MYVETDDGASEKGTTTTRRADRSEPDRCSFSSVSFVDRQQEWDQMYPTFSEDPHVGPHFYAKYVLLSPRFLILPPVLRFLV